MLFRSEIVTAANPPELVLAWIAQLLSPEFLELMRHTPYDRIDVRLSGSRGKVAKEPMIVLNGGAAEFRQI